MTSKRQNRNRFLGVSRRGVITALALTIALVLTVFVAESAPAQTFQVIHNFTGGQDGSSPSAGLTMDAAGNLYGTNGGGGLGQGTVFKLKHSGSSWVFTPLYVFQGGNDGATPLARVIFGPDGSLYGTTAGGGAGGNGCCGTVFNLKPPPTACMVALCDWTETVLYRFKGGSDGAGPQAEVVFDRAGNLYGTTTVGGAGNCSTGCGVVFKLTPSSGGWKEKVLYQFSGGADGALPSASVTFDEAGNLYGTTIEGGDLNCNLYGCGVVFQLTPSASGWTENTLYAFQNQNDGGVPYAGVIFDQSGNLYGATSDGGASGGGTAFELTPSGGSGSYSVLYSFAGTPEGGPRANLVMDKSGNLYGSTEFDGAYGYGAVFKLTFSGGDWMYNSLYDFTDGADGAFPAGAVTVDANGNLYGTAQGGGGVDGGVVWEITP